ncbi:MAG: M20 family metallopeptidase, partial [Acidimicrobiia bacterium]|nr:M20 family metallopeptidase [Acidimicrobiia bacterium]
PFAASIIDREIWGRGSADQKAGICAILEALRAIGRSGCRPRGSVTALFVSDEESGQPSSGVSAGMKAALADGTIQHDQPPDFVVYTEPTTSAIYTAQMGFLIADITLTGQSAYFGRPELGVDALRAGHRLLTALWEHSESLRTQPAHPLIGEAFLLVTEVRSGESIAVPGRFNLSLIRKVLPHESLDAAAQSIRDITARVAADNGVEASVEFTAPRDHPLGGTPDETPAEHPAVQALGASITAITGNAPRIEAAPYWSEKSFLSAIGVPGVYFAPGDISHAHTPFERVEIDELVAATRTLAHFVASWCGLEPAPTTN